MIIDNRLHLFSEEELVDKLSKSTNYWIKMYPDEPFDIDLSSVTRDVKYESKCKYDLVAACARQRKFFYHVSLPHYENITFLSNAVDRYKKFITLKKEYMSETLVPMYDQDLIWHTHQLCSADYRKDMIGFMGQLLHHDDTVSTRKIGSKRNNAELRTKDLWYKEYGTQLALPGTMFRGDPPFSELANFNDMLYESKIRQRCCLRIDSMEIRCKERFSNTLEASVKIYGNSEVLFEQTEIGKSKQFSKGYFKWDCNSNHNGYKELPICIYAEPEKRYKFKVDLTKRGRLKGLLPSKEYTR